MICSLPSSWAMQFGFAVLLFACTLFIKEAAYRRLDGSAHFLSNDELFDH